MFADNTQQRVERTLFESLRQVIVAQGYIPDITNSTRYPMVNGNFTQVAQTNWETDLKTITTTLGWSLEIFGVSSVLEKGLKRTPRVVIVPKRIFPGDIGFAPGFGYENYGDINNPTDFNKFPVPDTSADMHFDIHLVSSSAEQNRFLNMLITTVFGLRKYLTFQDNSAERFFLKQFGYYEVSDTKEGEEENVYSYEIKDLYLFPDAPKVRIAAIKQITIDILDTVLMSSQIVNWNGDLDGGNANDLIDSYNVDGGHALNT